MDNFFQKWGWMVVAGVIIVIVITMSSPLGDKLWEETEDIVEKFSGYVVELELGADESMGNLNDYGFYFDREYKFSFGELNGEGVAPNGSLCDAESFIVHQDGSMSGKCYYQGSVVWEGEAYPAGTFTFSENAVMMGEEAIMIFQNDGKELVLGDVIYTTVK